MKIIDEEENLRQAFVNYLNEKCPPIAYYSLTPEERAYSKGVESVQKIIGEIISRHKKHAPCPCAEIESLRKRDGIIFVHDKSTAYEPLAELADRKGVYISDIRRRSTTWWIHLDAPKTTIVLTDGLYHGYSGETYTEAESKARQYLEALPDVKGEK